MYSTIRRLLELQQFWNVCVCVYGAYYLGFFFHLYLWVSYSCIKCEFCELYTIFQLIPSNCFSFAPDILCHFIPSLPHTSYIISSLGSRSFRFLTFSALSHSDTIAKMFGKCLHKIYVDYILYATRRHMTIDMARWVQIWGEYALLGLTTTMTMGFLSFSLIYICVHMCVSSFSGIRLFVPITSNALNAI